MYVKGDTALSVASSVEITLMPDDNAILNPGNSYEKRRVTVKATYGSSDGVNDEYDYQVKNLAKVSTLMIFRCQESISLQIGSLS
jgi:hypothetical protein